jgi:alpha-beta hydrolase superfamily lysophospholipase
LRAREAQEPGLGEGSQLLTHGGPTAKAFVLIHGLTASPPQVAALAERLYERGANVFVPRLPRHGLLDRMSVTLADLEASELEAFATEIAAIGGGLGERRTIAGFSVGGLLCAWIAQHHAFERAVAIAPFLGTRWIPHRIAPHVARAALALPNAFVWWNPLVRERLGPAHGYPRFSTHAVARVYGLVFDLFAAAAGEGPATPEILFVVNASEATVHNRNVRRLARAWRRRGSARVDVHVLRGLPPSHDIIEPLRAARLARRVTPTLVDLIDR